MVEIVQDRVFYSRLFLLEKTLGGWRPVIGLLPVNILAFSEYRVEKVVSVLASIWKEIMFSIDLKDAYFQIPIHP